MNIFKEMFMANLKELIRDREGLFWLLAFPIIFIFIFGVVFSGSNEQVFNVGLVTENETTIVTELVKGISDISSFNIIKSKTRNEAMTALKKGQVSIMVEIPEINRQDLNRQQPLQIKIYSDASRRNTNQMLISAMQQVFNEVERGLTQRPQIFTIKTETVQAQSLSDFDYILPGILAMALMQLGLFGSFQFLSLREQKIIRGLGVTPLSRSTLLSSEILVRLIVALVQTFLIVVIGQTVFGVTIVGSLVKVTGIVILGSLTFISLGYMLISFASSMESGRGIVQVVQFPMMFLSGIFFPVEIMPDYIKPVVKAIPLTYLGDALRQEMVGAAQGYSMTTNLLVLTAWLLVTLVIGIKFWKWE